MNKYMEFIKNNKGLCIFIVIFIALFVADEIVQQPIFNYIIDKITGK